MNLLKLPNVSTNASANEFATWYENARQFLGLATVEEAKAQVQVAGDNDTMTELVRQAVLKWPQWQFKLKLYSSPRFVEGDNGKIVKFVITDGDVSSEEGISIGKIYPNDRWKRYGGSDKTVKLRNARINKARQRSDCYETKDWKAAIREMKKTFYAPTVTEVMEEAKSTAWTKMRQISHNPQRKIDHVCMRLAPIALDYISSSEERMGVFEHWCRLKGVAPADTVQMLTSYGEERKNLNTIVGVQQAFDNNKTVLVVKTQNGYILQFDKDVKLCDDSTLPQSIRAKLGMLKLVEPSQVVDGVGCRVNDDTFVVVSDETPQT